MFLEEAKVFLDIFVWQSDGENLPFESLVFSLVLTLAYHLLSCLGESMVPRAYSSSHAERIIVQRSLAGVMSLCTRIPHFHSSFDRLWALFFVVVVVCL